MKIDFFCPYYDLIKYKPYPIKQNMPDWFRKLPMYHDRQINQRTVKACVPFVDAMTSGYCIPTPFDLKIKKQINEEGNFSLWTEWGTLGASELIDNKYGKLPMLDFSGHDPHQYTGMPFPDGYWNLVAKFVLPWSVRTPGGYSCLFIPPVNRERKYFEIVSGIIDTDLFEFNLNFPIYMKDWDPNEGPHVELVIPGCTPIAHVFPFKRDNWKMNIGEDPRHNTTEKKYKRHVKFLSDAVHNYRNKTWRKKSYK